MSKFKKIKLHKEDLKLDLIVNINSQGLFYVKLPSDIEQQLKHIKYKTDIIRKQEGYIYNKDYNNLLTELKEILTLLTTEKLIKEEIILQYRIKTYCAYCKNKLGEFLPNGQYQELTDGTYDWKNGTEELHSSNRNPFGFSIYVKPQKRLTYKQYTGNIIYKYDSLTEEDEGNDKILKFLNDLCGISLEGFDEPKDIVYTYDVGVFFYNAILFVMQLTDKLNTVLNNKQELINLTQIEFKSKEN